MLVKLFQGSALKPAVLVLALEFRVQTTVGNDNLSQLLCLLCHVCVYVCVFLYCQGTLRGAVVAEGKMQHFWIPWSSAAFILFYLWLCWVFVTERAFSSCSEQGLLSSCGIHASYYSGFSCCRARVLEHEDSVAMAHGLNCPAGCGIFPDQGSNLCPLHW